MALWGLVPRRAHCLSLTSTDAIGFLFEECFSFLFLFFVVVICGRLHWCLTGCVRVRGWANTDVSQSMTPTMCHVPCRVAALPPCC